MRFFGVNFILQKFCPCKKMTNIRYGLFLIIVLNKLQMIHSKTLIGFCCSAIRWLYFLEKICVRISCKGRKLEFISFSIPPRVLGGKDTSLRVSGPQGFPFLHVLLDLGFQIVLNLVEHN